MDQTQKSVDMLSRWRLCRLLQASLGMGTSDAAAQRGQRRRGCEWRREGAPATEYSDHRGTSHLLYKSEGNRGAAREERKTRREARTLKWTVAKLLGREEGRRRPAAVSISLLKQARKHCVALSVGERTVTQCRRATSLQSQEGSGKPTRQSRSSGITMRELCRQNSAAVSIRQERSKEPEVSKRTEASGGRVRSSPRKKNGWLAMIGWCGRGGAARVRA